jgi:hypothetical protein
VGTCYGGRRGQRRKYKYTLPYYRIHRHTAVMSPVLYRQASHVGHIRHCHYTVSTRKITVYYTAVPVYGMVTVTSPMNPTADNWQFSAALRTSNADPHKLTISSPMAHRPQIQPLSGQKLGYLSAASCQMVKCLSNGDKIYYMEVRALCSFFGLDLAKRLAKYIAW